MKNQAKAKAEAKQAMKANRLAVIELADEHTEHTKEEVQRNVGAEREGGAGFSGALAGDANTMKSGDSAVPVDSSFG